METLGKWVQAWEPRQQRAGRYLTSWAVVEVGGCFLSPVCERDLGPGSCSIWLALPLDVRVVAVLGARAAAVLGRTGAPRSAIAAAAGTVGHCK